MDIQTKIRDILSDTVHDEFSTHRGRVSEQELMQKLRQRGIVDDILHRIQFDSEAQIIPPVSHFTDRDDHIRQMPSKKGDFL